jgi:retron-type reverse transcriptase
VRDRVVQAALKLVLEPIFEADFKPCSNGFRPKHRAHDAVAEVRHLASSHYCWVLEGDIEACLNASSHCLPRRWVPVEEAGLGQFDLDSQALPTSGAEV